MIVFVLTTDSSKLSRTSKGIATKSTFFQEIKQIALPITHQTARKSILKRGLLE